MATINLKTTPINFATFKSITDTNGAFDTWTDIITKNLDILPVNEQILGAVLKSTDEVTGDNIVFQNTENKNIYYFNDDITKDNNKPTVNKMVMMLYTDYMLPFETDSIDKRSAYEWSQYISQEIASLYQAKNDIQNLTVIDEINKVNIALGQVKIFEGCDGDAPLTNGEPNFKVFKNMGLKLAKIRTMQQFKRTKFSKGFNSTEMDALISPQLSINLLSGLTSDTSAPNAYTDTKSKFKINNFYGYDYKTTMYLGQDVGMSEFTDTNGTKQNEGAGTGNMLKYYNMEDLHGLLVFRRSIAFYGHQMGERTLPKTGSRLKDVTTFIYRMDAAVKPVFANANLSIFSKVPKFKSYVKQDGTTVPEMDLSTPAGMNLLRNNLLAQQPQLYKHLWNANSNLSQQQVTKIWNDAKVTWK